MKAHLHVSMAVPEALERINKYLTKDKFLFSEEDATYFVSFSEKKAIKTKKYSKFWSRRDLSDKYPENYSIVIEGILEEGENETIINIEIIEYHHGREHYYGGTRAIEEYFDKFCTFFEC
jgi:hypothetical protein